MEIQAYKLSDDDNLSTWAAGINAAHAEFVRHAESAVEYARRAGMLLLKAKRKLPHGQFGDWLAKNIAVSTRQAQRYMATAQGKRSFLGGVKSDKVSYLNAPAKTEAAPVFKIRPGEAVVLEADRDDWTDQLHIFPSTHPGFFHYLFVTEQVGVEYNTAFSKKPIPQKFIPRLLAREMPDWEFANITRTKHGGRQYNVMGTAPDGTDWVGNPPWISQPSASFAPL